MKVYRVTKDFYNVVSDKDREEIDSEILNTFPFKKNSTFFYISYIDAVKFSQLGKDGFIVEVDIPVEVLVNSIGIGHYLVDDLSMDKYDAFEFLIDNDEVSTTYVNTYPVNDDLYKSAVDYNKEFSYEPFYKPELMIFDSIKNDKERVKVMLEQIKEKEKQEMQVIKDRKEIIKTIKP